jgi:hypothetical protein
MTTQRKNFLSLYTFTSNVGDKICTVDLFKLGIPALSAPDVLQGYVRTRVSGLLVFESGLFAKFERDSHFWHVTMARAFPREALEEFAKTWDRELLVDHPHVPESHTGYRYDPHSFEEMIALVELLKQKAGRCVDTDSDLFRLTAKECGWGDSTVLPTFQGKGCVRTEIRALRAGVAEISVCSESPSWATRHETCLADNEFGRREGLLLRMHNLAESNLSKSDPDLARVRREVCELYQERVRWAKRMLDLDSHDKEALVLLTLDLERSQRERARFLKKLGRAKQERSALAGAVAVVPALIGRLEAARAESAKKYAEAEHPWWGRRTSFFAQMLARFYAQVGDRDSAARCNKEVAALRSAGHNADGWVERWVD